MTKPSNSVDFKRNLLQEKQILSFQSSTPCGKKAKMKTAKSLSLRVQPFFSIAIIIKNVKSKQGGNNNRRVLKMQAERQIVLTFIKLFLMGAV